MNDDLLTKSRARQIVKSVIETSSADDTFVSVSDSRSATLRFANNQVVQHVDVRSPRISVRVALGNKTGSAQANRFDPKSLGDLVARAMNNAQLAPPDPEYLSPLGKQSYLSVPAFRESTAEASALDRANKTKQVLDQCLRHGLIGAGIVSNRVGARCVAASTGLFAYQQSTEARFSLTASSEDSSGWTLAAHRDIDALNIAQRAGRAIFKALRSKNPIELPAGHYPVILEPTAVAGILGPLFRGVSAKSYYKGNSALAGKLDTAILDQELSLHTDPSHPDLLGQTFGRNGAASRPVEWIKNGALKQLRYDRFTAKKHNVDPTPRPGSVILSHSSPKASSIDELIASTKRAILITNLWYIRFVDPTDLTVTGMTRDGTFLVEDGKIVAGVRNFRFHDSPLRCLANVDAATQPMEAVTLERSKMLLPALRLPDFFLSSVTKF